MRKILLLCLLLLILILILENYIVFGEQYLFPNLIDSSSYLLQNDFIIKDNYHPYYVIDDNPKTAWVEGEDGDGLGEYIRFFMRFPDSNIIVSLRNGYQKSEDLYYKNNRVKEIEVRLTSGTPNSPIFTSHIYELKDEMGWQQLDVPVTDNCWAITFIVQSVYKGTKYDDTCISDIKISFNDRGNVDGKQQEVEKSRFMNWFLERSKKANFFRTLPKDYPFKPYKLTIVNKNISSDRWYSSEDVVFKEKLFNESFGNENLKTLLSSPNGISLVTLINKPLAGNKTNCAVNRRGDIIYTPDILSEPVFMELGQYYSLSNLMIAPVNIKTKNDVVHEIYKAEGQIRKIVVIAKVKC